MKNFKEWLSDYLRYFMLAGIIVLVLAAAIFGIKIYSKVSNNDALEARTTEQETPKATETEKTSGGAGETETDKNKAGKSTEATEKDKTGAQTEATDKSKSENQTEETKKETEQIKETQPATQAETQPVTQAPPETEAIPETEPAPVYLTLNSACYIRSAPDYGDNIMGEYWGGTTVRFIEDVGGWYKVEVDGMIGYMGAKFF